MHGHGESTLGPSQETPAASVPRFLFAIVRPFRQFFRTEAASGIVLMLSTAFALVWANSRFAPSYEGLLHLPVTLSMGKYGLSWPLHHWINDALMSIFFLVVGLEIKRELIVGELRTLRRAILPAVAALGGMIVPAAIHFLINRNGPAHAGWGIPMATDIAFALGGLALVAGRVPSSLVVFLMALAIFDDLGAILVIALFYGGQLHTGALATVALITILLILINYLGVRNLWPFLLLGTALWIAVLKSGIHATIAGVILGLCIPAQGARRPTEVLSDLERALQRLRQSTHSQELDAAGPIGALERHLEAVQPPLDRIVHGLHTWVAFGIIPIFAIANAGVMLQGNIAEMAMSPAALGAALGLLFGKPIGIFSSTWLAIRIGLAPRPTGASWAQLFGVSILAGIGFTMSIFVATLAFPGEQVLQDDSKVGIFLGSALSLLLGLAFLHKVGSPQVSKIHQVEDLEVKIDLPRFAEGFRVESWIAQGNLVGHTLGELELRKHHGISVLGTHRGGQENTDGLKPVGPLYSIQEGDTLLLVGAQEDIDQFLATQNTSSSPEE